MSEIGLCMLERSLLSQDGDLSCLVLEAIFAKSYLNLVRLRLLGLASVCSASGFFVAMHLQLLLDVTIE